MRSIVAIGLAVMAAAYAVYVSYSNDTTAPLSLLPFTAPVQLPLGVVVLSAFVAGGAAAALLLAWPLLRLRLRLRGQSRRVTRLEQEVHGLRTLPLADADEHEPTASVREG